MPRLNERQPDSKEENIRKALIAYRDCDRLSIRATAEQYGIPYSTLRGRIAGVQDRVGGHRGMQVLTEFEENSMVRWCEKLDEWGHPPRLEVVKSMAQALLRRRVNTHTLGKHWLTRFLNRNPMLASKLSSCLDRQRARADDPRVIKDYFQKVAKFCIYVLLVRTLLK